MNYKLELLRFLRANENWQHILTQPPYNIKITYIPPYYHLYCANPTTTLQRETNGIVLNEKLDVVCYGFNAAAPLSSLNKENEKAKVTQFVGGYWFWVWNDGKWHFTTPTHFDAYEMPITNKISFGAYIDKITNNTLTHYLIPTYTYMFQLVEDKVWYYGKRSMQSLDFEKGIPYFEMGCAPIHIFSNAMWDDVIFTKLEKASDTELGCTFWNDELWVNKPYKHYKLRHFNIKEVVRKYFNNEEVSGFARPLIDEIDTYINTLDNVYKKLHTQSKVQFTLTLLKMEEPLRSIFKKIYDSKIDVYTYYKEHQSQLIENANLHFYLY